VALKTITIGRYKLTARLKLVAVKSVGKNNAMGNGGRWLKQYTK
jgi:hypothetical protein